MSKKKPNSIDSSFVDIDSDVFGHASIEMPSECRHEDEPNTESVVQNSDRDTQHIDTQVCHDATQLYLNEIGFFNLLTKEEELRLAFLCKRGNALAHRRMIESNLRLVVKIAKHYVGRGMLFLDLIEEGNLGLMHAVDKFNPALGFRFSTYATWWIRQAIERALMNQNRMVRLPIHKEKLLNAYLRATRQLSQTLDHEPTCQEIAEKIDKSLEEIYAMQALNKEISSLDAPLVSDHTRSLLDSMVDDASTNPETLLETMDMSAHLDGWFHQLKPREQEILARRFGLYGYEQQGLTEVGKAVGLTRERVRQIQVEALKRLHTIISISSSSS